MTAFKACIIRCHNSISALLRSKRGFPARKEFKVSYNVFHTLAFDTDQLVVQGTGQAVADPPSHWPYFFLRREHVVHYLRLQINRYLFTISNVLSTCWPVAAEDRPASSPFDQYNASAMLAVFFFDVLTLTINSGQTGRSDRIAKDMYYRQGEEPTDSAPAEDEARDRMRRGLALLQSLRQCNLSRLPYDIFQWDTLRFDPDILLLTAYSNTYLERSVPL
nr:hypothetical protein B0A51_06927 [Rachicladosporium sp. CCFEE 5018]